LVFFLTFGFFSGNVGIGSPEGGVSGTGSGRLGIDPPVGGGIAALRLPV
jgi:hypothetical protein